MVKRRGPWQAFFPQSLVASISLTKADLFDLAVKNGLLPLRNPDALLDLASRLTKTETRAGTDAVRKIGNAPIKTLETWLQEAGVKFQSRIENPDVVVARRAGRLVDVRPEDGLAYVWTPINDKVDKWLANYRTEHRKEPDVEKIAAKEYRGGCSVEHG